jgi:hypothetical protein
MTGTDSSSLETAHLLPRLLDAELSRPSRLGHVALLLVSMAMTVVVVSLWLTEPALPVRTRVAFGAMTVIGVAWMVFAGWVLTTRRVLLGRDNVVAGRLAVTFTAVFVAGALLVGYSAGGRAPFAAAAIGVGLLGVAIALLVRARRRVAALTARRDALERELGSQPG